MGLIDYTKPLVLILLGAASSNAMAELKPGDMLYFDEGSKVALEVSPGFWIEAAIQAGRGLIIGASQADKSIDVPFDLFKQTTQHLSYGPVELINADSDNAKLDFSAWAMNWRDTTISLGTGASEGHDDGVAVVTCEPSCAKGEAFTLEYSATIPSEVESLGGLGYRLHMTGLIE